MNVVVHGLKLSLPTVHLPNSNRLQMNVVVHGLKRSFPFFPSSPLCPVTNECRCSRIETFRAWAEHRSDMGYK
ncbi:MAG: hypothetical protein FD178_1704 [Ignavibacteria bacterium]|nr:MAG: hypothetical protein FD178_1704 [Ignavibacteria bacterium]